MMAVSQPEGDAVVDLLLKKGADVTCKSSWSRSFSGRHVSNANSLMTEDHNGQVSPSFLLLQFSAKRLTSLPGPYRLHYISAPRRAKLI